MHVMEETGQQVGICQVREIGSEAGVLTGVDRNVREDARRRAAWLDGDDVRKGRKKEFRGWRGVDKERVQERKQGVHDVDTCDCPDCFCERKEVECMREASGVS